MALQLLLLIASFILAHAAVAHQVLEQSLPTTPTTTLNTILTATTLIARQTTWPESDWAVKPSTFTIANPYDTAPPPTLTPTSIAASIPTSAATATAPVAAAATSIAAGPNLGHAIHRAVNSVPWWGYTLGAIGAVFVIGMVVICFCCRNRGGGGKGAYEPAPDGEPAAA